MLLAFHILEAAARIKKAGYIYRTPLVECEPLKRRSGLSVFHKLELFQNTGSFKLRGATNRMLKLASEPELFKKGFVTCSAGNHGIGMCYSAQKLGAQLTVVIPETVSPAKLEILRSYPIELLIAEGNYDQAEVMAVGLAKERNLTFVSPYNDPDVAAGQGTVVLEALEDLPEADVLVVPVGGGGLLAGIAVWAKSILPYIKIYGVQSESSPCMYQSLEAGKLVQAPVLSTLADGLAGNIEEGAFTFEIAQKYLDGMVLVSETEITEAIRFYAEDMHLIVEGSGAVGTAALLAGKIPLPDKGTTKIIDFVTGRNISVVRLKEALERT